MARLVVNNDIYTDCSVNKVWFLEANILTATALFVQIQGFQYFRCKAKHGILIKFVRFFLLVSLQLPVT